MDFVFEGSETDLDDAEIRPDSVDALLGWNRTGFCHVLDEWFLSVGGEERLG